MLLASPQIKADEGQRPNKTVVLAIDRSGSMSGEKIEQAKAAAKFVINNLREGDTFNLIAYDDEVTAWQSELQRFNDDTRKAALGFVEGVFAGGGTNINGALTAALSQLHDSGRPTFVIFLTDGIPTVGETNEAKIVANARSNNKVHARIFDFGVGYDVNSRLLDKLARENFGLSEYVRPNENIERSVSAAVRPHRLAGDERREADDRRGRHQAGRRGGGEPGVSQGRGRSVCRRAVGDCRPVQETGRGESDDHGQARRRIGERAEVRVSRAVRRAQRR